jgi:negative regulator of sigma E activity
MAERKDENLRELFEDFVGPEQAKQAAEDIQRVEQMLEENPAPEPSEEVQWQIKERICQALEKKRKSRRYWMPAYRAVAVAAVIIFVFVVSIELFKKPTEVSHEGPRIYTAAIPAEVWEGSNIIEDDAELSVLSAEIAQIEDEYFTVQLGQGYGNGKDSLTELELELMDIDSEFWERIEI